VAVLARLRPAAPVADPARAAAVPVAVWHAGVGVGISDSVGCIIYIFETPVEAVV